jgi:3-oxoacyl-(acyl-carrier-protein) synthase
MKEPISITALGSISPMGVSQEEVWQNYKQEQHFLSKQPYGDAVFWTSTLSLRAKAEILKLSTSDAKYTSLDPSVLYAMYAARKAVATAGWKEGDHFGINIGSSRGATSLFEKYHQEFILNNKVATLASPTTTLGNISSWVAHDLQTKGPDISHSITCSTALHAVLNGVAWLQSGLVDKFLVGGSEAPLTPFTIAQMNALKIYARGDESYPCRAADFEKKQNSMVLGEGAALCCLEKGIRRNSLALITGIGYATEPLEHTISISTDALCFQRSMQMALKNRNPHEIDAVIMHAPGTLKGDRAELKAIEKVFGSHRPALTNNKWKLGHTFGTSGMLSMEMAVLMLQNQEFIKIPYIAYGTTPTQLRNIMINAVGFGGNAVSVILSLK